MRQGNAFACGMGGLLVCVMVAGLAAAPGRRAPAEKPKLDPSSAVWTMKLSNVYGDEPIVLHLATKEGKVARCFGLGEFNKAVHEVDASALAMTGAGVKGTAKVTINADRQVPPDGKSIECRFDLDVLVKDDRLGGSYQGKRRDEEVSGMVMGAIQPPAKEFRGTIQMQLEQVLAGDSRFQAMSMTVPVANGQVGKVAVAKAKYWSSEVKGTTLAVDAEAITGEATVEVKSTLMTAGTYTITFDGKVIGDKVAGRFKSRVGDKVIKESGMFSGSVR